MTHRALKLQTSFGGQGWGVGRRYAHCSIARAQLRACLSTVLLLMVIPTTLYRGPGLPAAHAHAAQQAPGRSRRTCMACAKACSPVQASTCAGRRRCCARSGHATCARPSTHSSVHAHLLTHPPKCACMPICTAWPPDDCQPYLAVRACPCAGACRLAAAARPHHLHLASPTLPASPRVSPRLPTCPCARAGVHGLAAAARPHHGPGPAARRPPQPRLPDRHQEDQRRVHLL